MALIKCYECGAQISDQATSCPKCGAPLKNIIICEDCGNEIIEGMEACPKCGCPVEKRITCEDCGAEVLESMEACPKCGCPNPLYNTFQKENVEKSLSGYNAKKYYIVIICIIAAALFLVLAIKGIGIFLNNNDSDNSVEENYETVFEDEDENLRYALKKLEQYAKEKFYIKTDEVLRNQIDDCHFALLFAEELDVTNEGFSQRIVIEEYENDKNEEWSSEWSYFPKSSKLINQIELKLQEGCFYDNKGNKVGIVILHFLAGPGDDFGQGDDYLINEWDFELLTTEDVWYNGEYIRMQ